MGETCKSGSHAADSAALYRIAEVVFGARIDLYSREAIVSAVKTWRARAEQAERERDEARAEVEQAERERDESNQGWIEAALTLRYELEQAERERDEARAEVERLRKELERIANAPRHNRDHFTDDTEFADWAQSRARHTLEESE